ncbi:MAG: DNA mismatch repair protein MutS [Chlamydiia bacterium]|nr:DNA mismatch repair protein MutS [Chlamydiia bacterium]
MAVFPPTPMMTQWQNCKAEAKDALLLFRLGDFYEAFHKDAEIISKEIGLTLTARQTVPMCGVPFHTAESYIDKLLAKGYKVAIAEQTEDPKQTKGLVKREIVRIVTPGTLLSSQLLSDKRNNFFLSLSKVGTMYGFCCLDLSTGELSASEMQEMTDLLDELHRLRPSECLASETFISSHAHFFEELSHAYPFVLTCKEHIDPQKAYEAFTTHFPASHPDHGTLRGQSAAISATGMLLLHLKTDLHLTLEHISSIQTRSPLQAMAIDRATLRHLELTESLSDGNRKNTLLGFLDATATPMGGRLLSQWLKYPLLSLPEIHLRQEAIGALLANFDKVELALLCLSSVRDLERLMMKTLSRIATPRDLLALGASLAKLPELRASLRSISAEMIQTNLHQIFDADPLAQRILSSLQDSPPLRMGEGEIFRDGFHPELDQLRILSQDSANWASRYQITLREQTGIKTLKVGYTKAAGYYIEISKAHREKEEKIPPFFQRRQTLSNGERFTTEELKQFEHQALTSEERAKALEERLFEALRAEIAKESTPITRAARSIAQIDALLSLAKIAHYNRFVRPLVDHSNCLEIHEGRHPLVERSIGSASFIPNDLFLSPDAQMMLITGPNMAGKSTYIRQAALIVILAQMGSYVPAAQASIGLIDKVFSRIGASDDLSRGQSTFMVEMTETAGILNHATSRSLILLDEIGRGTSTYDGISIAWAVAEFLLTTPQSQAKTLFTTHYWELTQLESQYPHARNFQTAVQETSSGVVFLRKIVKGGTDKSYGIHVAKLAGLPAKALRRAEEMLAQLEAKSPRKQFKLDEQLSLFTASRPTASKDPILSELEKLETNHMTPMQALQKLIEWKQRLTMDYTERDSRIGISAVSKPLDSTTVSGVVLI